MAPESAGAARVAVLGADTPIGAAAMTVLSRRPGEGVIAVAASTPPMVPSSVEVRTMDVRDRLLPLVLDDVDVVVHAAFSHDLRASPDALYGANVRGTRSVLAAVEASGVRHLVVVVSAVVYGAHPDNPLPLTEDMPLRANPGFAFAHQQQLVDQMARDWADAHPDCAVTVLRVAPVIGGSEHGPHTARLLGPRLLVPAGGQAPWQFIHVDDIASAIDLVVAQRVTGVRNVAADGWLSTDEVAAVTGRGVLAIGQSTFVEALGRAAQVRRTPAPPEVVPYLQHPWALDAARLRSDGWQPSHSNLDAVADFVAEHDHVWALGVWSVDRHRVRRGARWALVLLAVALWKMIRR